MTIGEKIANLRAAAHISQEQLAEKLSVSRQSVSKWEINQSLPQIDNVLTLCKLFRVTADALLRDDVSLFGDVAGKKSAINETGAKTNISAPTVSAAKPMLRSPPTRHIK